MFKAGDKIKAVKQAMPGCYQLTVGQIYTVSEVFDHGNLRVAEDLHHRDESYRRRACYNPALFVKVTQRVRNLPEWF